MQAGSTFYDIAQILQLSSITSASKFHIYILLIHMNHEKSCALYYLNQEHTSSSVSYIWLQAEIIYKFIYRVLVWIWIYFNIPTWLDGASSHLLRINFRAHIKGGLGYSSGSSTIREPFIYRIVKLKRRILWLLNVLEPLDTKTFKRVNNYCTYPSLFANWC